MLDSIHAWFVKLATDYNLVLLGLLLLLANWPVLIAIKFKFPDDKKELPLVIKKKVTQIFFSSLPLGFIVGIALIGTSESTKALILIPFCTVGFPIGEVIVVSIGLLRMSKRHYLNSKD